MQMFSKKMMVLEALISWHKATMLNTWCFMKSEVCVYLSMQQQHLAYQFWNLNLLSIRMMTLARHPAQRSHENQHERPEKRKNLQTRCVKNLTTNLSRLWSFINQNQLTHAHITEEPAIETRIDMRTSTSANHAGTHSMTLRCTHCIGLTIKGCNYLVANLKLILVHEQYCDLTLVVDNHPQTHVLILPP